MKRLLIVSLCATALLLAAGTAQAWYFVTNDSGHSVCLHSLSRGCLLTLTSGSSVKHNATLPEASVIFKKNGQCYGSQTFGIPEGGTIIIGAPEIKLLDNKGKLTLTVPIAPMQCPEGLPDIPE